MAIAFSSTVGTTALAGTGATISTTVGAAGCAAGNLLVVAIGASDNGSTITAIVDTKLNTYQVDASQTANKSVFIASSILTTSLVSGDVITVTYSLITSAQRRLGVYMFTGSATSSWLDGVNSATNTSTSPNSGNVTTTNANDLLFGCCDFNNGGVSYAPGSTGGNNYIELDEIVNGAQNRMQTQYVIVNATGTYSSNGTITSTAWNQCFACYKGAAAASTVKGSTMMMMGAG